MNITIARLSLLPWIFLIICTCVFLYFSSYDDVVPRTYSDENGSCIDGSQENMFWFIQFSDLHFSKADATRLDDMLKFCKTAIPVIQPSRVFVSGDLTDAKSPTIEGQQVLEWDMYTKFRDECAPDLILQRRWHDMRGNHDSFFVDRVGGSFDYYSQRSLSRASSIESSVESTEFGKYRFLTLDVAPDPGAGPPINFFGHCTKGLMDRFEDRLRSTDHAGGPFNHTFVFGHYPLSFIHSERSSTGSTLQQLMSNVSAYMPGHLHTMYGWVPVMWSRINANGLQAEARDWRDNRSFRIVAVDHDLVSFIDDAGSALPPEGIRMLPRWKSVRRENRLEDLEGRELPFDSQGPAGPRWPVVLVTNPKDARHLLPGAEPHWRMSSSSHVRLLVFSDSKISTVEVSLNFGQTSQALTLDCSPVSEGLSPLYTCPWDPSPFGSGVHTLVARAIDANARVRTVTFPFSLDGTTVSAGFKAEVILYDNFAACLLALWIVEIVSSGWFLLLIPRFWVTRGCYSHDAPGVAAQTTSEFPLYEAWKRVKLLPLLSKLHYSMLYEMSWLRWMSAVLKASWYMIMYRLCELAATRTLWRIIFAYHVFLSCGPWFFGALSRDLYGFFFPTYLLYVYPEAHYIPDMSKSPMYE
eukprot:Rmarinus@m.27420